MADEIGGRKRRGRQSKKPMGCLDPMRMTDVRGCDLVGHIQERNRIWTFETRQVEIAEEHDVGIQDAIALVRQRDRRGNLQKLLYVPAADRLGSKRPPILTPIALDEARQ